jgi:hypothetical protein
VDKFRLKRPYSELWNSTATPEAWQDLVEFVGRQKPNEIAGFRIQVNRKESPRAAQSKTPGDK